MNEIDATKKSRIAAFAKIGLFLLTGFVVAPFIFLAVKGIVGLAAAALVGLTIINVTPVLADKFANWRLKAIKAEASKNPIETLQLDYSKRQDALGRFKETIVNFTTAVANFADKLEGFKSQFSQDSGKFEDQLSKMKKLLSIRRARYKEAEQSLDHYEKEIERAQAIWEMGLEAAKMNAAAGMTDEDFMQKIKVETALDSVTSSMNTAFAELETSLIEEDDEKQVLQLTDQSSEKVPVAIEVKHKTKEVVR